LKLDPGHKVPVSASAIYVSLAFLALGWLVAFFLFGKVADGNLSSIISKLGVEIVSALFVGSSAGVIVNSYLKRIRSTTPEAMIEESGIAAIYPSRQDAASEFLALVQDSKIKRLNISGISLRDFLTGGGRLRGVWNAIYDRLQREEHARLSTENRLHVRLLLLDPKSSEGVFRDSVEKESIGRAGLPSEVPLGFEVVSQAQRNIYDDHPQQFLQIRLYDHCPFAFLFATNTSVFVEQYYYRDHREGGTLPLSKHSSATAQYGQLLHSFETIWEHAGGRDILPHHVGTANAIEGAKIRNIYRREQRGALGEREIECIGSAKPGETIDILAISGAFFLSHVAKPILCKAALKEGTEKSVRVRFALATPVCEQAILRAIADSCPGGGLREALWTWSWERHINTRLYLDIHQSMIEIEHWRREERRCFELRLYFGSISCALLLTPNSAFVEQYLYGRSKTFELGRVLGGEYPVFEYMVPDTGSESREWEILSSTFDAIWNAYSISYEEYKNRNEKDIFERNLETLRSETTRETSVVDTGTSSVCAKSGIEIETATDPERSKKPSTDGV
jgi:hypothetical protein